MTLFVSCLIRQMAENEDDNYVTVRKPTGIDIHRHHHHDYQLQHPDDSHSRPSTSSLASRPLSEYSCRPNDSDDNYDNAENRKRTQSPICALI